MIYYVDQKVSKSGNGEKTSPFQTIQEAAEIAGKGDQVLVAPGVYREHLKPRRSGVTYRSLISRRAVISGAEPIGPWKQSETNPNVWTARVDNRLFGDWNPFAEEVSGDWFMPAFPVHRGDLFLNHRSMYEVPSKELTEHPKPQKTSRNPAFSVYVWYAEQEGGETVFTANFQERNPNREETEISVRNTCVFPEVPGINDIVISGFVIREAASQWAPPTAFQDGMVGVHWSKGWIIEDCEIYESKCAGISLGKYLQPENDNKWLKQKTKDGTQTQRECVMTAVKDGWKKETVGSHTIRKCDIHDCGQAGIAGHMGGVFSIIEDNEIHHINEKGYMDGAEIAGIKLHAAIDVILQRNRIHHCTKGIWLDWQAQGTRVSRNLFHDNCMARDRSVLSESDYPILNRGIGEDLFIEVSHGPTLIDRNLFLSERSVKLAAQGCAFVNNLFAGSFTCVGTGTANGTEKIPSDRYTPYHFPHDTAILGFMTILHGDVRFYENIFVQMPVDPLFAMMQRSYEEHPNRMDSAWDTMNFVCGTFVYDGYPDMEEWESWFEGYCGMGSANLHTDRCYDHLPVFARGNVYLAGARPWEKEKDAVRVDCDAVQFHLREENKEVFLDTDLFEIMPDEEGRILSGEDLGKAFEPEEKFENPDGSRIVFDRDYFGIPRSKVTQKGPFHDGKLLQKMPVWKTGR